MQYKVVVNISKKELKVIKICLLVYTEDQFNILLQSKELIFTIPTTVNIAPKMESEIPVITISF